MPERLWEAITDPEARARYQLGARVESDWAPGSHYAVEHAGARGPLIEGENLGLETGTELTTPGLLMYGAAR